MMKKLLTLMLLTAGCLSPLDSLGAEAVRFVHALTVYADGQGESLNRPEGVACRDNVFVVADTVNGRLLRYTLADASLGGGEEIKIPEIPFPSRLQISSKGEIFVLDGKTRKLARLGPELKFIGTVEPRGLPEGRTPILRGFALDRTDNIYLLDVFGERVIILDPAGQYQREIAFPAGIGFISDLTVDGQGTIYLLDSVKATVYAAAAGAGTFSALASNLKEYLTFPTAISTDNRGTLFLVDRNGSGIVLLGPDGSYRGRQLTMGWKPGLLYYPSALCLTGADEAVIADRDNSRVQVFKLVR
jgi:sugar lactone lactonase YvrE